MSILLFSENQLFISLFFVFSILFPISLISAFITIISFHLLLWVYFALIFLGSWGRSLDSVQSLSRVRLFATPWTAACQASLSITNCWSLPKLMSIESVMPSNHLILCCPLLLLPSIFPNIRVFSNDSALLIR